MNLTEEDIKNIETAIEQGGDIWNNPLVSEFKRKTKEYYRVLEKEQCCYCKKNFQGEFNMVIDIEHILPKSKPEFRELMFVMTNLNIACKRCNMQIKSARTDFLYDRNAAAQDHENPNQYKFIHPNSDNYFNHLKVYQRIENEKKLIKYKIVSNSTKGKYTYDYFRLNELEIDSLNQAQGLNEKPELSSKINSNIQNRLRNAFKRL